MLHSLHQRLFDDGDRIVVVGMKGFGDVFRQTVADTFAQGVCQPFLYAPVAPRVAGVFAVLRRHRRRIFLQRISQSYQPLSSPLVGIQNHILYGFQQSGFYIVVHL